MKNKILLMFLTGLIFFIHPFIIEAKKLKVYKEFKNSLKTDILGTSETFPPYVKIIRSKDGVDYMLREFKSIRNYTTHGFIKKLDRELSNIKFKKYMLIAVMTQPVDNYSLKILKVQINSEKKKLEIFINYSHDTRIYEMAPKKSIYYHMIVVKKSDLPILLNLNNVSGKEKVKQKSVYVTGRLLYWKYSDLQLVPIKIKRRKSIIHYIKGGQVRRLEKYVGRVVTLKGTLSRNQDSPYEKEIMVEKVTKVHEKL